MANGNSISFSVGGENSEFRKVMMDTQAFAAKATRAISASTLAAGVAVGGVALTTFREITKGINQILAGVKMNFELGARLAPLSKETGMAAGQLYLLEKAMKKAGLEGEGAAGVVSRLNRVIYAAGDGNQMAQSAFNDLGVSMAALQRQSPLERFQAVASAIAGVRDEMQRAAIATKIFGKSGDTMQALFASVRSGDFDRLAQRIAPQANALSQNADKMRAAVAKLNGITGTFQSFYAGVAASLVDTISGLLNSLKTVNFFEQGKAFGGWIAAASANLSNFAGWVQDAMDIGRGGMANLMGSAAWIADKMINGLDRAAWGLESGFWGAIAISSSIFGALTHGVVSLGVELKAALQWAFQAGVAFFDTGIRPIIDGISASLIAMFERLKESHRQTPAIRQKDRAGGFPRPLDG